MRSCIAGKGVSVDVCQSFCKQARPKVSKFILAAFNKGIELILCAGHLIILQIKIE
jgi:predicted peroxiredoxin